MRASDLRRQTLERRRELAARHEALSRLGADPARHADQLARVFDATNDLVAVLDRVDARAARRRGAAALTLLVLVVLLAALVTVRVLPAYALIAALLLLVAAVVLWLTTRRGAEAPPEDAA